MTKSELEQLIRKINSEAIDEEISKLSRTPKSDKNINPSIEGYDADAHSKLKDGGFSSFSDFAKAIYDAGENGVNANEKLKSWIHEVKSAGDPSLSIGDPEQGHIGLGWEQSHSENSLNSGKAKSLRYANPELSLRNKESAETLQGVPLVGEEKVQTTNII